MLFFQYFDTLKFFGRVWVRVFDLENRSTSFARNVGAGLFTFILLGKPFSDVIFFGEIELSSFVPSILLSPLVAGGLLAFEPSKYWVRVLSLFHPVVIFISTCVLISFFEHSEPGFSVYSELNLFNWVMPIGLDNFSVLFIILTSFLFRLTFLSCWVNTNNVLWFFELLFITEFILFFVFTVLDPFWFLIAYESIIVPVFLIIGIWGGRAQRVYAAYPSPHYTFAGSVAMSSSIIHIYLLIGSTSFLVVVNSESTVSEQVFLFSAFPIAFASKLPLYPFHSWSPEAHVEAPTAGSVSLAGISLKMGGYGLIRWCFPLFPVGITMAADLVNTVAGLSVSYASFPALQQLDIKKIIAYSSIAHMGFVVMGLFTSTELGLLGAIFLMVTHGFISAGLFPCIGVLYDRYGTRSILYYGGLGRVMPLYDTIFFVLCLANIALPGTAGFPGESSISYAVYSSSPSLFGILLLGVLTTGIYTIWMYSRVMMGPIDPTNSFHKFSDVSIRELCMFGLILIPVLVLGLFPTILFHIYNFWILKWIQVI